MGVLELAREGARVQWLASADSTTASSFGQLLRHPAESNAVSLLAQVHLPRFYNLQRYLVLQGLSQSMVLHYSVLPSSLKKPLRLLEAQAVALTRYFFAVKSAFYRHKWLELLMPQMQA